jgi:four helix bundle protein
MKSYRDLEIYKTSKQLAIRIHKMSLQLPKFEMFEEGSQIRRFSKSVIALIVEDYGRRRNKVDLIKYLIFAQSGCDDTIVHLDFLFETKSLAIEALYLELKMEYDTLSKQINKFTQWVEANLNTQQTGNQQPATGN